MRDTGTAATQSQEKANLIRAEYEKRLNTLQAELKKLEAAKMEHLKLLRNQSHNEKQLKTLEHNLVEMKKQKVKPQHYCVFCITGVTAVQFCTLPINEIL